MAQNFYEAFASFYDAWLSSDPTSDALIKEYTHRIQQEAQDTTIVYLGIATGRIAVELMQNTQHHFIGIDYAKNMLTLAQKRLNEAKLSARCTLLHQDILKLTIASRQNLFILPLRTLGHFISIEDKKSALCSIYKAMKRGEKLIFDMEHFNEANAKVIDGKHQNSYYDEASALVLYNKFSFDFKTQIVNIDVYKARLKEEQLEDLKQFRYQYSWISPSQQRAVLEEVGFKNIELLQDSPYQLWQVVK